jgi:hypothetical protein
VGQRHGGASADGQGAAIGSRNTAVEALSIANENKGTVVMVAGSVHRLQVPIKIVDTFD